MVRRNARISQFISDRLPSADSKVQVLCEDHVGTYTLPFLCRWTDGDGWMSSISQEVVEVAVLGWREPPSGASGERPMWASRQKALR